MPSGWPALNYSRAGARPATRCTRTVRCSASSPWRSPHLSRSFSTRRLRLDGARVGDAGAAGARRLGGTCRHPRPAHPPGRRRAQRRARCGAIALTPDRPVGEVTRELLAAIRGVAGPVEINPTPQEVSVDRAARRGRRAPPLRPGPGRRPTSPRRSVPRWSWPASSACISVAVPGQRLGRARRTPRSICCPGCGPLLPLDDFIMRHPMDGARGRGPAGGPVIERYGKAASTLDADPARQGFANAKLSALGGALGRDARRVHPRLGRCLRRPGPACGCTPVCLFSCSIMPVWCASGMKTCTRSAEGQPRPIR